MGVGGAHGGVDQDAAVDGEAHVAGELRLGPHARADHQRVGGERLAGGEAQAGDGAGGGQHLLDPHAGQAAHAERLEAGGQQPRRRGVELAGHQAHLVLHDADAGALGGHGAGGLEPEQPAADHRHLPGREAAGLQGGGVVGVAEGEDVARPDPGDRGHEGARAGADHQVAEREQAARGGLDQARVEVDGDGPLARVVTGEPVAHRVARLGDLAELHLARQQGGELDAVVGRPVLGVEQGDGAAAARQLARHAEAGGAAADDDDVDPGREGRGQAGFEIGIEGRSIHEAQLPGWAHGGSGRLARLRSWPAVGPLGSSSVTT